MLRVRVRVKVRVRIGGRIFFLSYLYVAFLFLSELNSFSTLTHFSSFSDNRISLFYFNSLPYFHLFLAVSQQAEDSPIFTKHHIGRKMRLKDIFHNYRYRQKTHCLSVHFLLYSFIFISYCLIILLFIFTMIFFQVIIPSSPLLLPS